jgi:hypothetical protein
MYPTLLPANYPEQEYGYGPATNSNPLNGKVQTERMREVKSKVKRMLTILSGNKGNVHQEFVLAHQMGNSEYCCDVSR